MKLQGKVLNWNDDKGYGFVEPNGGGERAFVHVKAFNPRTRRPVNGDFIIYELVYDNNDRYKAENIKFSTDVKTSNKKTTLPHTIRNIKHKTKKESGLGMFAICIFCIGLVVSTLFEKLPAIIVGVYLLFSCITFMAYAIDKSAAKNGRWRTSESTLHFLSFIGGWPGAYWAQRILRHKSSKQTFKRVFGISILLNLVGLIWLHTEKGTHLLTQIASIFSINSTT
jgi:uncharacterized membrane protein YsdA (DUF1294 family)/cold shock CspA family protein